MANPKYNKARGLWVIQGQKNGGKKVFYSSTPGPKGKREVVDKYNNWISYGSGGDITVGQCVELYLEDIEARLGRRDSYREAETYTRLYVLPGLGKCKMNNLSLRDWQALINNARPQIGHIKTLSYKTLTHLRAVIVGLHKFAYNNYYCEAWRGTLYIPQGHPKGERDILQPEDIKRLFEPSPLWYYPAFLIMLLCGLRPGECYGIQKADIKSGVLYISRAVNNKGEITPGKNKNARRVVPLPALARDIIEQTIARNDAAGLSTPWVFCNGVGGPPIPNTARHQYNDLKAERGLPGSPYSLRHTFVSIVASQTQIPEGTIRELVGHSDSMDTFGTYKHTVDGELESAASIINLTFERLKTAEQ